MEMESAAESMTIIPENRRINTDPDLIMEKNVVPLSPNVVVSNYEAERMGHHKIFSAESSAGKTA